MSTIIFLVVGGLIGWVASMVMKTNAQMGIIANVIVGIVGSWLGSWVAPKLGIQGDGTVMQYAVAVGGAVLLILILKFLKVFK
jgi:uncharacterized membrane protein YeaQ/YmgE (transglycosylase-associated protein family)